ncbi:MAG: YHS domain-containing protein [Desulfobulbaceae bacterium]|nr:YHS domain-containing protein [Desulfobulbaceae bacterium]
MSPVKLIVLGVLFYLLYRLLFGGKKSKTQEQQPPKSVADKSSTSQDILVEDPVCHTYVPQKQAIPAVKNGKKYYFCSNKCCQEFLADKVHDTEAGHKHEGENE